MTAITFPVRAHAAVSSHACAVHHITSPLGAVCHRGAPLRDDHIHTPFPTLSDFVAKRDDLEYYFKSLAAPEMPNKTDGKPGEKEKDPFAAPEEETKQRF